MPWDLSGNKGTNPTTNFLGTTDNQPLVIKANGAERMRIGPDGIINWGNKSRLSWDQGGSLELGADDSTPGTGTPYIDFHFRGLTQDFNTRIINDANGRLSVVANTLGVTGDFSWGNGSFLARDQGGSLELGGNNSTPGTGTPYIDFHFQGKTQDFNARIINHADGVLSLEAPERVNVFSRTLSVSGNIEVTDDIRLLGADCAEDFDVSGDEQLEAGTVMVIDKEGALKPSEQPYDKRVAGVISGAGDYRAGLLLDRQEESEANRMPVALVGKVACKVEARDCPIEVGDLLTTAPTPGYAMKANDPSKAPGAVIGKALQRLTEGQGLIGILVALQ
jgi:hypothetical protein